jgi:hypothetical protein
LKAFLVGVWHTLPPFTDTCLPAVLVKETVAGSAAQTHIVKPQERPPKLLELAARRTGDMVKSSGPAQEMSVSGVAEAI